jgi:hypothetical protein
MIFDAAGAAPGRHLDERMFLMRTFAPRTVSGAAIGNAYSAVVTCSNILI